MYKIEIAGEPVPKARPRVVKGHAFTPAKTKAAEEAIMLEWVLRYGDLILEGPLLVEMRFGMKAPKKTKDVVPQKRPDIDNLVKTVLDALNGVAYLDDKQVFKIEASKSWAEEPYTKVTIREGRHERGD